MDCFAHFPRRRHLGQRLSDVRDTLRAAHADFWGLVRPVQLSDTAAEPNVLSPLPDATVALTAVMDAGQVPCSTGGQRLSFSWQFAYQ